MSAFTFLATKRVHRESHAQLSLLWLAASGDSKAVKKQFDEWERDS